MVGIIDEIYLFVNFFNVFVRSEYALGAKPHLNIDKVDLSICHCDGANRNFGYDKAAPTLFTVECVIAYMVSCRLSFCSICRSSLFNSISRISSFKGTSVGGGGHEDFGAPCLYKKVAVP